MHTPGPWSFRNNTLVQDTGNRLHLGVFHEAPGLGNAAAANARLIASAPDLLDALQSLVEEYEPNLKAFALNAPRRAKWESARAAIARATGK